MLTEFYSTLFSNVVIVVEYTKVEGVVIFISKYCLKLTAFIIFTFSKMSIKTPANKDGYDNDRNNIINIC